MKTKKQKLIVLVGTLLILGSYFISRNAFKENSSLINIAKQEEKNIVKNTIAAYIIQDDGTYKEVKEIPQSGYQINSEKSICNNGAKISGIVPNIKIDNLTKGGTSCYLYFDKQITASSSIIEKYKSLDKISNARGGILTNDTEMDDSKIYSAKDNYGTSYVFAGANPDNYVKFAGYWWRIIRINGDNTIRMIYNGIIDSENPNSIPTGAETQAGTSAYNTDYNDNAYIGYMYGTPQSNTYKETHINTNSSAIKINLENWYKENIENKSKDIINKIDINGIFCNDREVKEVHTYVGDGTGSTATGYGPWERVYANPYVGILDGEFSPTLLCNQEDDKFSYKNSSRGNKKLEYPVGLITSDEVVLSGDGKNREHWLKSGESYWTMSPYYMNVNSRAYVFIVYAAGHIGGMYVDRAYGIRPVINLKSDITFSGGDGTIDNPYIVSD